MAKDMAEAPDQRQVPGWIALIVVGSMLSGCEAGSSGNTAATVASAVPPTEAIEAQVLKQGGEMLLYPYDIQNPEISYVGTLPNGNRWICIRARIGATADAQATRTAIAVLSSDTTLIGIQTNCPTCQAVGLGWLPFPELDQRREVEPAKAAPVIWTVRPDRTPL